MKKENKERNKCCLDMDTGLTQCMLYIGAAGMFLISAFCYALILLSISSSTPHTIIVGGVALMLGVLFLAIGKET